MAREEETSLVILIRTLNSVILSTISALLPALQDHTHASQLRQDSQRLQIWSNELGIGSGGLEERLQGEQELEYSIVTLHIMIAQGLITAENCTSSRLESSSTSEATKDGSITPLQLAIASLEKQYPQFSDNFSAASISTRTQSVRTSDGITNATSDVARNDTVNELSETLAEVSMTIDRLLRLAPFLEQYLEGTENEAERGSNTLTSEAISREADVYIDRILTRFPQASNEHVRIIGNARQRFYSLDTIYGRNDPQYTVDSCQISSQAPSDSNATCSTLAFERSILDDTEIPYPGLPQYENGRARCSMCGKKFSPDLGTREWRSHVVDDYRPYTCLAKACTYPINSFSHLSEWFDHMKRPHSDKFQWTCKLCGSRKFAAKLQLQYHAETVHYIPAEAAMGLCELWQDKVAAQEEETECIFCNESYGTREFARVSHLGRHMVEIALLMPVTVPKHAVPPLDDSTAAELYQELSLLPKTASAERPQETGPRGPRSTPQLPPEDDSKQKNLGNALPGEHMDEESDSDGHSEVFEHPSGWVEHADFDLEELSSDPGYDSDVEIIRPASFEPVIEEESTPMTKEHNIEHHGFTNQFRELHCSMDSSDEEERRRIYRKKKKRWSAGVFKRSHSQSVGSSSDYSDNAPLDESDSTARRLRRRVRGPGDRTSLIFEERDVSNAEDIKEDGEKNEETFTLGELPFWNEEEVSVMEYDSV